MIRRKFKGWTGKSANLKDLIDDVDIHPVGKKIASFISIVRYRKKAKMENWKSRSWPPRRIEIEVIIREEHEN